MKKMTRMTALLLCAAMALPNMMTPVYAVDPEETPVADTTGETTEEATVADTTGETTEEATVADTIGETPEPTTGKPSEHMTFYITKLPDKLEYKLGEKLDLTGGMAFAGGQYDDGQGHIMNWDDFEQPMTYYEVDDSAFNSEVPGFYPIYLTCKGQLESETVSFNVLVGELPTTLPPETTEPSQKDTCFVFHHPGKMYYNLGENLDLSGGYAWTLYWNGNEYIDLTEKVPLTDSSITIDASEYDNTKPGVYTIHVNKYYDFSVVVLDENGNPPEGIPAPTEQTEGTTSTPPIIVQPNSMHDLNGDGTADILDIIMLNKYMLGICQMPVSALAIADVNGDGVVDAADGLALLKHILGIGKEAVQEPEEPATEPTTEPTTVPAMEPTTEPFDPGYEPVKISEHFYGARIERGTASDGMQTSVQVLTDANNSLIGLYNYAFYENYHLITLTLTESSGSNRLTVDDVKVDEDGFYTVMITRTTPEIATCDLARWYLYIATDKGLTDASKVKVEFTDVVQKSTP